MNDLKSSEKPVLYINPSLRAIPAVSTLHVADGVRELISQVQFDLTGLNVQEEPPFYFDVFLNGRERGYAITFFYHSGEMDLSPSDWYSLAVTISFGEERNGGGVVVWIGAEGDMDLKNNAPNEFCRDQFFSFFSCVFDSKNENIAFAESAAYIVKCLYDLITLAKTRGKTTIDNEAVSKAVKRYQKARAKRWQADQARAINL